jgi:hypothetical protein
VTKSKSVFWPHQRNMPTKSLWGRVEFNVAILMTLFLLPYSPCTGSTTRIEIYYGLAACHAFPWRLLRNQWSNLLLLSNQCSNLLLPSNTTVDELLNRLLRTRVPVDKGEWAEPRWLGTSTEGRNQSTWSSRSWASAAECLRIGACLYFSANLLYFTIILRYNLFYLIHPFDR